MEVQSEVWDYFVIGGGSGGMASSKEAAQFNAKVAVADFVKPSPIGTTWGLGGTCVNVGCIPKKLMHFASEYGEKSEFLALSGWTKLVGQKKHDWCKLVDTVQKYIKGLNWNYKVQLSDKNVKYFNALAKLKDKNTIQLTDQNGKVTVVKAKKILIAVGGRPTFLDEIQGSEKLVITSDDLFSLKQNPGKTLIVGASYIALECAGFLTAFGNDTTVMVRSILLRGFDREVADKIGAYMEHAGTKFIRGTVPSNIEATEDGQRKVTWEIGGQTYTDVFDTVMLAIGRSADTDQLGVKEIGIKVNKNGKIIANDDDSTSVQGVYAIGDCAEGRPELTPAAIMAGRLLSRRLFDSQVKLMNYKFCPTTVFTPLEYGVTGYSEQEAKQKFGEDNIKVYRSSFKPLEWNFSKNHEEVTSLGKMVTLTKEKNRIIGLHYLGPNAGEVIQGYAVAVLMGATKEHFDDTIGIHPTNSEELVGFQENEADGGGC